MLDNAESLPERATLRWESNGAGEAQLMVEDHTAPQTIADQPVRGAERGVFMSVADGAIGGDFSDNETWTKTGAQVGVGFIPIAGQIADARDTAAALRGVWRGEAGGWGTLGLAGIAWIPGVGDWIKAAVRGGQRVLKTTGRVVRTFAKRSLDVTQTAIKRQATRSVDDFMDAARQRMSGTRARYGFTDASDDVVMSAKSNAAQAGMPKGITYDGMIHRATDPKYASTAWKLHAGDMNPARATTS